MRTQLITHIDELEAVADEWRQLSLPSPMQSPDWLIPWWRVYGEFRHELAALAVRDVGGELVALCPWYVEARSTGRRLHWLGDGAVCSDHAGVLLAPQAPSETMRAIVEWVCDYGLIESTQLRLEAGDADEKRLRLFASGIRRNGWLVTPREEPGSCYISLPGCWEEYLASVSKNHRKRCRKWQREFFDTGRVRVDVADAPADCVAAYDELVRLHNQRRQTVGCRGAFEDAQFRRFHKLAVKRLARSKGVQLRLLSIDEELAAVEYVLTDGAAYYAYQSGLSDAGAEAGAGSLSILSLLRDAVGQGLRRVDLLRGAENYKFSWGAVHRPAHTLVARRKTVSGLLQTYFDRAMQQARGIRKQRQLVAQPASSPNLN